MTPKEQKLLESYIDNIIVRCDKMMKVIFWATGILAAVIIIFAFAYSHSKGWNINLLEGSPFFLLMTISLTSWYLIMHLSSCQNACELIKVQLFSKNGGLDAAASTISATSCTQNINMKTLIQPTVGGN